MGYQSLFHSWKSVLMELTIPLAGDTKFQQIIAQSAADCLSTNAENQLPEEYFLRLTRSRADLAFALLECLNRVNSQQQEAKTILSKAWHALRHNDKDFSTALLAENADYHRTLLRILYLALQIHVPRGRLKSTEQTSGFETIETSTDARPRPSDAVSVALEIIPTTVAEGFRSLTNLLHESPQLVLPSDFTILTAILRSCFQVPSVTRNTEHLTTVFFDNQIPRFASTLLSWSDQLAAFTSGDPVYGEIAILFLLEISTVEALAETLAVEGVLSYIMTTNLIRLLQGRAFGPFDTPQRMYTIWSRGILPLLLNLLHAVGPPIAAEVAAALNTFPHQLKRAGQAFANSAATNALAFDPIKQAITMSTVQEAHCLAMIVSILRTFREAGASAAVVAADVEEVNWDATQVKEDVEGLLSRRAFLRDHIVPTNEREESLAETKPNKERLGENKLEERVLIELSSVVGVLGGSEA